MSPRYNNNNKPTTNGHVEKAKKKKKKNECSRVTKQDVMVKVHHFRHSLLPFFSEPYLLLQVLPHKCPPARITERNWNKINKVGFASPDCPF